MQQGYGLIEVLVVVLIVGILTAVALPQYQKAVAKAEYARAKVAATTLAHGMEVYYETYKEYTPMMEDLDVWVNNFKPHDVNCTRENENCRYDTSWGFCTLQKDGRVNCHLSKNALRYTIFLPDCGYKKHAGKNYCFAMKIDGQNVTADDWSYKFCQQETGSVTPSSSWGSGGYFGFEYVK